ncbi:Probable dihydrolipoamide dehydrogenase [Mycobacteroides abscessus]|uniref:Dihydrolipoyl dehydrogenase n=4 Tax=Mycobacteroides abscessus TaxID=36809 RepID=A0A1U1AR26_9MYCO|nr:dihydrolipoamide dehydrogenase [Mycobacteroides abscessus subsp. bolletii 50594]EHM15690.1 dihydrolipoamide dehydrogenase [Mycobacteroides abscessus subsp. massiliense CCUG 48898 = JCM 15300]EPQ21635.1 dihydrolipoyl dehydrogenase [Mycobacteroides abscessus subsp. bolletii CRM-0020]MBE5406452.1 dihydrolipoyl dehydrogenase [Mycobacteroides abscessus]SIM88953.1 dihydrolipoamide dehydrogenase [Mycobacteroides abscessus subsp. bolletii]SKD23834.1 Probable dihydrolipoamide dehydrogenase [Mycobact
MGFVTAHYDVVVLGAGPGGYVAAIRAAQLGLKTAIVEEKYWGGVCLNVGCIPSKALLRNAELAHIFTKEAKTFGISGEATFDFGAAFDRSRKVAEGRVAGVHFLMKKNKITEYEGVGTFTDANTLAVKKADGSSETLTFANVIIATGSSVRLVPGTSLSENVVTYEKQILTRELPGSIIIAGAGAIGMEFAYVLKNYGVDVTIVEFLPRALPNEDAEVSKEIEKQYKKLGVKILTGTKVESITDSGSQVTVKVSKDGQESELVADKVLQAIGFAPNVEGFGLENTGVALTDRGAIAIDERMRTNVPHIYAIGDVTSKLQLAHVAEAQAVVAAETIAGAETLELGDYRMMPRATFCQPQVASFGLTEEQARAEGYDVKVAKFPFTANGKAHGLADPTGFVKLIADAKYGELIGGHLIGPDVSELLPELTLAQKWDLTVNELTRNVHTHPTLSEALQEAFHGLAGHMINF